MGNECADRESINAEDGQARKAISNKVIAIVIIAVLLGSSGFYIWHEYYRHWSISDLERAAIVVEWECYDSTFPNAVGFRQNLAGRTVIVEGTVSSTETVITTLGSLTIVYLEGGVFCSLMLWDEPAPEDGTRVEIPVTFERGTINGEEGVYSRQTTLPGFGTFARLQPVFQSLCWTFGELVLKVTDTGDEIILDLEGCPEPIPLDMIRCNLMAGAHMGTQDWFDAMGQYSENLCLDTISDLNSGTWTNETITYEDDDGYLDGGDSFVLSNLSRPDTDCGAQTYFLNVERGLYPFEDGEDRREPVLYAYIIMTKRGVLWVENRDADTNPALCDWHQSTTADGQAFILEYTSDPPEWERAVLVFWDGRGSDVSWSIPDGALNSGSSETLSLGIKELWNLSVECVVTDLQGNSLLDPGDRIEIVAVNGTSLETGGRYSLRMIDSETNLDFMHEEVLFRADPTSECAFNCEEGIAHTEFFPLYNRTGDRLEDVDVVWGEVIVRLESDGNSTEWRPETEGLWGDGETSWESEASTFGGISLVCLVRDLQGNGAVNTGDTVMIAVNPIGDGFEPGVSYTVSFSYAPTGATIFSATFIG